jgi:hypothetical protein
MTTHKSARTHQKLEQTVAKLPDHLVLTANAEGSAMRPPSLAEALLLVLYTPRIAKVRQKLASDAELTTLFNGVTRKIIVHPQTPAYFDFLFTAKRPSLLLDAALGLYLHASDTGAPPEAAPTAAFALAKLNTTLDAQRPSRAYAFVAKNVGILMGVPELAALGERHTLRAFGGQKDEAKRAQMRRVLTDVRSLNPQIRGG